jgi:S1-C subfamily serine protease
LIGLLVVLGGAIGAALEFGLARVNGGVAVTGANAGVVDVTSDLGTGSAAAGTGMVITSNGEVLTNNHVVEGALRITVQIAGTGTTYAAAVLGVDPANDVAVLQIPNVSGLPTVGLGDSTRLSVGDGVTVVGNALGRGGTPQSSSGSITALGQTVTASDPNGANSETLNNMIQFDATIQPGDSGGPLLDRSGKVVGMDTAGAARVRRRTLASNVGFAIPINTAMSIAQQLASSGAIHGALLGVRAQDSTNLPGAQVISVEAGTPADNAGIVAGDVITAIGGTSVDSVSALHSAMLQHHSGDRVIVDWLNAAGQQRTATVQLATAPPA